MSIDYPITFSNIPGCPDYMIGSDWMVWSFKRYRFRRLKPYISETGYHRVLMMVNGDRVNKPIHYLVLLTFKGPRPSPKHVCRHLDGNKLNNAPSNLAWGTPLENSADGRIHGTIQQGEKIGMSKLREKDIPKIRKMMGTGISAGETGKRFGIAETTVFNIWHRRTWRHVP